MITLDKWYPYIIERQGIQTVAFNAAVKKVQEEYALAVEANKKERITNEFVVDLYNKNAPHNTLELEMFENRRRFQIFV